jgi:hypothetical protein
MDHILIQRTSKNNQTGKNSKYNQLTIAKPLDGFSTLYWKNGSPKYEGFFKKGRYHKYGTVYSDDQGNIRYIGSFKNHAQNGYGKQYYFNIVFGKPCKPPAKLQYDGYWRNGKAHGLGKYNSNGLSKRICKRYPMGTLKGSFKSGEFFDGVQIIDGFFYRRKKIWKDGVIISNNLTFEKVDYFVCQFYKK